MGGGKTLPHGAPQWFPPVSTFAGQFVCELLMAQLLMAENQADLQRLLSISAAEISDLGQRFSARKTVLVQFAGEIENLTLTLDGEHLSTPSSYQYLGVLLYNTADILKQHEAAIR